MKHSTLTVVFLLCACFAHATTFTLNNNNPSPGQYTTFDAAQTAASSGDTILVHASPNSYDVITFTKSLTLIGPGHRPAVNGGISANFSNIFVLNNLINVRISGINLAGLFGPGGGTLTNNDNLTIQNCHFFARVEIGPNSSNMLFKNCIFDNSSYVNFNGNASRDVLFTNNYFKTTYSNPINGGGDSGSKIFSNNLFFGAGPQTVSAGNINNFIFENNIFYGVGATNASQTNCVYNNNLTYQASNNTLPPSGQSGSNNLVNVDPKFVDAPSPGNIDFEYNRNYRLQTGSPGLGAGTFGTNLGIYESDNEFSMTGEPARPQTTTVTVNPAVIPSGGSTQVNFTIRKSTPNQ
ncbi:MAG: hypothetical protein ACOYNO_14155 [Saprospiraceae bacterium]